MADPILAPEDTPQSRPDGVADGGAPPALSLGATAAAPGPGDGAAAALKPATKPQFTRIQREKRAAIFDAALDAFAEYGLDGATLDQIARGAGLSKPNVIYYFDSKVAIYTELLESLLDVWLAPLVALGDGPDPVAEFLAYVDRKLEMSRTHPRESRLFAREVLHGAPHIGAGLSGGLKDLVDAKAAIIDGWVSAGQVAPVDAHHLIFSVWATTQHYADFDVQVQAVLGPRAGNRFEDAARQLAAMYRATLTPDGAAKGASDPLDSPA
ncbi:MAG: TetR family transcriptional regulator C-terminal domain-containing protein [Pseudomonadota bacterium]